MNTTSDMTFGDENQSVLEESKRLDDTDASYMNSDQRLTTKEKVQKLKDDLKKRKALLRGELDTTVDGDTTLNDSIQIDTAA